MSSSRLINRNEFLRALAIRFPEIARNISGIETGLLHLEVAAVAHATLRAVTEQRWETVESHFVFINEIFADSDESVKNAVYVSYLENVFLGESSINLINARKLLPVSLGKALSELEAHFGMLSNANHRP